MTTGPRHLVLVGLSGVGKSTVAAELATQLGRALVDTDDEVTRAEGRRPDEIIRAAGIEEFRTAESSALRSALASAEAAVIATGGGIVESTENRQLLAAHRVVWLDAAVAEIATRVASSGQDRPMLDGDPVAALAALDARRRDSYAEVADVRVHTDGRQIADVVAEVRRAAEDPTEERR